MGGNAIDRGRNDPQNAPPPRWQNISGGGRGGGVIRENKGRRRGFRRAVEMVLNGNTIEGRQHRGRQFRRQPFTPPPAERDGKFNHANLKEQGGDYPNKQVGDVGLAGQLQHPSSITTTEGWQNNHRRSVSCQPPPPPRAKRSERCGNSNHASISAQGVGHNLSRQINHTSLCERGGEDVSKHVGEPDLKGQLQRPTTACNELSSPLSSVRPPLPLARLLKPALRAGEPPPPPPPPDRSSVSPKADPTHHCGHEKNYREEKNGLLETAEALTRAEELVR